MKSNIRGLNEAAATAASREADTATASSLDTIDKMIEDAEKKQDATLAIKLAQIFKEQRRDTDAIKWVYNARCYNPNHPVFSDKEALIALLSSIKQIEMRLLFGGEARPEIAEWLLNQINECPSCIRMGSFSGDLVRSGDVNDRVIRFLKATKYIKVLKLSSGPSVRTDYKLGPHDFEKLATGLQINSSIEFVDFNDQPLDDSGLKIIIDALGANPKTKIKHLNIFGTKITDEGLQYGVAPIKPDHLVRYN